MAPCYVHNVAREPREGSPSQDPGAAGLVRAQGTCVFNWHPGELVSAPSRTFGLSLGRKQACSPWQPPGLPPEPGPRLPQTLLEGPFRSPAVHGGAKCL